MPLHIFWAFSTTRKYLCITPYLELIRVRSDYNTEAVTPGLIRHILDAFLAYQTAKPWTEYAVQSDNVCRKSSSHIFLNDQTKTAYGPTN